jgi:hypothetical protein
MEAEKFPQKQFFNMTENSIIISDWNYNPEKLRIIKRALPTTLCEGFATDNNSEVVTDIALQLSNQTIFDSMVWPDWWNKGKIRGVFGERIDSIRIGGNYSISVFDAKKIEPLQANK